MQSCKRSKLISLVFASLFSHDVGGGVFPFSPLPPLYNSFSIILMDLSCMSSAFYSPFLTEQSGISKLKTIHTVWLPFNAPGPLFPRIWKILQIRIVSLLSPRFFFQGLHFCLVPAIVHLCFPNPGLICIILYRETHTATAR